jgi:hypothetical protein
LRALAQVGTRRAAPEDEARDQTTRRAEEDEARRKRGRRSRQEDEPPRQQRTALASKGRRTRRSDMPWKQQATARTARHAVEAARHGCESESPRDGARDNRTAWSSRARRDGGVRGVPTLRAGKVDLASSDGVAAP